jgi:hypothetical protein
VKRTGVVPSTWALPALVAAAVLSVACYEYTGPAPAPDLFLTGSWKFSNVGTPAGGGLDISLNAAGGWITGTGQEYVFCCLFDSFTITGVYSDPSGSFRLAIHYSKGKNVTYLGTAWGADSLVGVWTDSSYGLSPSWHQVFYRQPVPPCADSAPLIGSYTPAVPGFLVRLRDSVDATFEAALLADRYGFVVGAVFQTPVAAFAADLPPATVAVLRCEPAVVSIDGTRLSPSTSGR